MPKQRFFVGEIVVQGVGWSRLIQRVIKNYLGRRGRFGYFYQDDFGYGMCSQEHLLIWSRRNV